MMKLKVTLNNGEGYVKGVNTDGTTLKEFRKEYDYTEYGGAVLLGTKKAVIKAHGNSKAKAIKNAIRQAKLFIESDVVNNISNGIEKRFILENKEDNEPDNVD